MNYCDSCDCADCVSARYIEMANDQLADIMEQWNWNLSPTECALEIIQSDDFTPEQFFKAMELFGFSEGHIYDVRTAYDVLS